jgi:hypothetical protein
MIEVNILQPADPNTPEISIGAIVPIPVEDLDRGSPGATKNAKLDIAELEAQSAGLRTINPMANRYIQFVGRDDTNGGVLYVSPTKVSSRKLVYNGIELLH